MLAWVSEAKIALLFLHLYYILYHLPRFGLDESYLGL
jgi:hypothetical protein